MAASNRLIVLAGPSCVGKSPLEKALKRIYPDLARTLGPVVLYNSRAPRPGEEDGVDYHFRRRDEVESLRGDDRYVVIEAREDLQALDREELQDGLQNGDLFYEGNPFVGKAILDNAGLADVPKLSIFMSPLSSEEIRHLSDPERNVDLPSLVTEMMRRKLLRRTRRQKGEMSAADLEDIETRANSAYDEMRLAPSFDYVLVNHDGEDSENWDAFYHPLGDARRALRAFVALLRGEETPRAETWRGELFDGHANRDN